MIKGIIQGILFFILIGVLALLLTKFSFYIGFSLMSETKAILFISTCMIICLGGLIILLELRKKGV